MQMTWNIRATGIRLFLALLLLLLAVFCIAYLLHDYETLARWYHSLRGPFYKEATWQSDFFTPAVKQKGNLFCLAALALLSLSLKALWQKPFPEKRNLFPENEGTYFLLLLVAAALGIWSATSLPIAADEAFSARYAAGSHPFRALSYYMLPNNHVLFNTLNAFVSGCDNALLHGRILSVLAYMLTGLLFFRWLREVISGKYAAFLISLLCLAVFPVWGFAGQARGYELYLLAHIWSLLLVTRYLRTKDARHLFWYPVAVVVGYGTVPTFLYFHLALLGWMIYECFSQKNAFRSFWIAQIRAFGGAFLFYVPALCFSGLDALIHNKYVSGNTAVSLRELPPLGPYGSYLTGGGMLGTALGLSAILLCLALLAFRKTRSFGVLACAIWLAADMVVVYMQRIPFHRNLTGQFALTFALAGVAVAGIFRKMQGWIPPKSLIALAVIATFSAGGLILFQGQKQLSESLYFYPVKETAQQIEQGLFSKIPTGSTVAFSEEAFLAAAFWQQRQGATAAAENADFIVQLQGEAGAGEKDSLIGQEADLQLYKKHP